MKLSFDHISGVAVFTDRAKAWDFMRRLDAWGIKAGYPNPVDGSFAQYSVRFVTESVPPYRIEDCYKLAECSTLAG
jgi:hypothetical protein